MSTAQEATPSIKGTSLTGLDRVILGMNALGSTWILLLILLVTADAIGRSFFSHPIAGVNEMVQISIVGIVFLQLADAIRNGKLTRADSFLTWLGNRSPSGHNRLNGVFMVLGAVYMGLALWGSFPLLVEAIERNSYLGNEGVFTVAVWPVKAVTVAGLSVCLIEYLRQALRAWRT
jgi:TRAP-type C4-dicarboxylate transport system permease small subunit